MREAPLVEELPAAVPVFDPLAFAVVPVGVADEPDAGADADAEPKS
jgi:hypothetical protein